MKLIPFQVSKRDSFLVKPWRILFPSDPAYMSKEQIAEWEKIKEDIIKDKVTISPGIVGGSLVTFSLITPVYSDDFVQVFKVFWCKIGLFCI